MDFLTFFFFAVGLVFLFGGADLLVRGSSNLAIAMGISPLVVGLTVVAFGTSAPELAVSVNSALTGRESVALGNVVGSNIFNVLIILGISSLIAPLPVARQLIRFDVPLMIGISFVMLLMGLDGRVGRFEGLLLFAGIIVYTVHAIRRSRREGLERRILDGNTAAGPKAPWLATLSSLALMAGGLALLLLGSKWLVDSAVAIAEWLGMSQLVIGLTIVSVGTSLPEVATSVVASLRGERDIAVGNVVGSNIFNILSVLGLTSLVAPGGVGVDPVAISFDIPVMIAVAFSCAPIFYTGHTIDRWEGALFIGYYVAYVVFLVMRALQHTSLGAFEYAMAGFVLPLTAVTLATLVWSAYRTGRGARRS